MEKRGIELSFSTFIGIVLGFIVLVVFAQFLFFLVGLTQSSADEASLSMFENIVRDINNFDSLKNSEGVLLSPYFINSGLLLVDGCGSKKEKTICLCKDPFCNDIVKGGTAKISRVITKSSVNVYSKPSLVKISEDHRKNIILESVR